MNKKYIYLLLLGQALFADAPLVPTAPAEQAEAPWFTGPMLASSSSVVPGGHYNFEPYVYLYDKAAVYDNNWRTDDHKSLWNLSFTPYFWVGLCSWADIMVAPAWSWNYRDGPAQWTLNDWSATLDIQLYQDDFPSKSWFPSVKIGIQETFPTGPYQNLNPKKELTDLGGQGTWATEFQLCIGKTIQIKNDHWFQTRLNLNYAVSTPVTVRGINAWGGGEGTKGTIHPGQKFSFDVSTEYSLTRNWVLACDFTGTFQGTSNFYGKKPIAPPGTKTFNPNRASIQYSIAPAIEYNWSRTLGFIAGSWITVAGKNSTKFYSAIIAVNYYR